jgi:hypothetical protein
MIEAIDPCLRAWLVTVYWTNVVGLAIVVPRNQLSNVDRVAVLYEEGPASREEPVICAVNKIFIIRGWGVVLECGESVVSYLSVGLAGEVILTVKNQGETAAM